MVKQAVVLRQADSRPPRWQVFWMTLMECGWKDRLTLIWTTLLELQRDKVDSNEAEKLSLTPNLLFLISLFHVQQNKRCPQFVCAEETTTLAPIFRSY